MSQGQSLLPMLSHGMFLHVTSFREPHFTDRALEWFLARVSSHMSRQIFVHSETLATCGATERLLCRMDTHVYLQLIFICTSSSTDIANYRHGGMCVEVLLEMRRFSEQHLAIATFEPLLSGVQSSVAGESTFVSGGISTNVAC